MVCVWLTLSGVMEMMTVGTRPMRTAALPVRVRIKCTAHQEILSQRDHKNAPYYASYINHEQSYL